MASRAGTNLIWASGKRTRKHSSCFAGSSSRLSNCSSSARLGSANCASQISCANKGVAWNCKLAKELPVDPFAHLGKMPISAQLRRHCASLSSRCIPLASLIPQSVPSSLSLSNFARTPINRSSVIFSRPTEQLRAGKSSNEGEEGELISEAAAGSPYIISKSSEAAAAAAAHPSWATG